MQCILIFVSQWKEAWISHSHSGVAAVECIKEGMFYPKLNNPNLQVWMDTKRDIRRVQENQRERNPCSRCGVTFPATPFREEPPLPSFHLPTLKHGKYLDSGKETGAERIYSVTAVVKARCIFRRNVVISSISFIYIPAHVYVRHVHIQLYLWPGFTENLFQFCVACGNIYKSSPCLLIIVWLLLSSSVVDKLVNGKLIL